MDPAEAEPSPGQPDPAPDLAESLRQVGIAGRASLGAAGEAARALRHLVWADLALARSALGRALAFSGLAIAFGASSWLLLMAALVGGLSVGLDWSWPGSLLLAGSLSLAITVVAGWQAARYFEHTRLRATLGQLARLGLGESDDGDADAPPARSADARTDAPTTAPSAAP
jgi:hypothetical protein